LVRDVCAFTSICQEDDVWIDLYLSEIERLDLPFAIHFDRCSKETKERLTHPLRVGWTAQDDPNIEFTEQHKQSVLNVVARHRRKFDWALAWDVDEAWEKDAPRKLKAIRSDADYLLCRWVNLWGDDRHIRVDGPFCNSKRVKFYSLRHRNTLRWRFDHPITNGAKLCNLGDMPVRTDQGELDLVCLHRGLMTRELRLQHKERWDRIYSTAVGENPYGIWKLACDEENYPPAVERNPYL
jgi:hypothetical protein